MSWLNQGGQRHGYGGLIEYYGVPHCRQAVKTRVEAAGAGDMITQDRLNCLSVGDLVL
jgi:hypothetical protein